MVPVSAWDPSRGACARARSGASQAAAARAQHDRIARGARRAGAAVGAGVAAGGAQAQPAIASLGRALRKPKTSSMQGYWRWASTGASKAANVTLSSTSTPEPTASGVF